MTSDAEQLRIFIEWLEKGLAKEGKTNTGLAKAIEKPQPRVAEMLKGQRRPQAFELARIANYLEEPLPVELWPVAAKSTLLPMKGNVQAGKWLDRDDLSQVEQFYDIKLPSEFASENAYVMRVIGNSMNLVYPPGTLLVCVDMADRGDAPENKKRYIIERENPDGRVEWTVKEFRHENGKAWAWPRSTDPEHQQPIELGNGHANAAVRIKARVLYSIHKEE